MESSLNMNTLANSLPTSNLVNAETDLMNNFKAAAMSITTLYRSSLNTSKRAYNAGYAAACQDLLVVIQQGVSAGGAGSEGEGGMTIGRVMDWVEARLEAVKTREDEEDEEERETKGKAAPSKTPGQSAARTAAAPDKRNTRDTDVQRAATPPTPRSPVPPPATPLPQAQPSSASPPPPASRALLRSKARALKDPAHPVEPFTFTSTNFMPVEPTHDPVTEVFPTAMVGAKRRHAVMLESSSPVSSIDGTSHSCFPAGAGGSGTGTTLGRRRTKTGRAAGAPGTHVTARTENVNPGYHSTQSQLDAMDIEDDNGRERKRVSRR